MEVANKWDGMTYLWDIDNKMLSQVDCWLIDITGEIMAYINVQRMIELTKQISEARDNAVTEDVDTVNKTVCT